MNARTTFRKQIVIPSRCSATRDLINNLELDLRDPSPSCDESG